MPGAVVAVSDTDFRKRVLQSAEPVLVAFRASWCVPSQQGMAVIDRIAQKYQGRVRVAAIDAGPKTERLCRAFNVTRFPVVMVFKDGEAIDFIGGDTDEAAIAGMLDTHLKPVLDLSEFNFEREVLKARRPVLVHFWAAWCRQSLEMDEVVNELATKYKGKATIARLEMRPDTARLCASLGVTRVPTTAVFQDGKIQDQIFGAMKGGTKIDAVRTSCVGLTSLDNLGEMLGRFAI